MATEDEQGRTLVDANMVGTKWQLVDTILPNDHAYLFPAGNGRVGDSDRPANVWIRDNGVPHDLTNETVSIWGLDAAGKVKIVDGYQDATDLAHGKITLMFPKQMYQANGDYRELWLQINNGDQVVSTINLHITVWQNNIIQTWSNSEDYVSKIDDMLTSLTQTVQNKLTELMGDIKTAQEMLSAIQAQTNASDFVNTTTFNLLKNQLKTLDKRSTNINPIDYIKAYPAQLAREVNNAADIGITQAMVPAGISLGPVIVDTDVPWTDNTLGWPTQTAKFTQSSRPVVLMRVGTSDTTWSAWELITTW